jgi:hypothetical protein
VSRTREASVSFSGSFRLPGLEKEYPAGRYRLRIDEEKLDVSFAAYRRTSTVIMLISGATTMAWQVDPNDLTAAGGTVIEPNLEA